MGKNSSLYNKVYHTRKREALIEKLGGKCEGCGTRQDLIIHTIFTRFNTSQDNCKKQSTFDGGINTVNKFTPVSQAVWKERERLLKKNRDNMVVLCYNCYSTLRREYGKKHKIGRQEILNTFGV